MLFRVPCQDPLSRSLFGIPSQHPSSRSPISILSVFLLKTPPQDLSSRYLLRISSQDPSSWSPVTIPPQNLPSGSPLRNPHQDPSSESSLRIPPWDPLLRIPPQNVRRVQLASSSIPLTRSGFKQLLSDGSHARPAKSWRSGRRRGLEPVAVGGRPGRDLRQEGSGRRDRGGPLAPRGPPLSRRRLPFACPRRAQAGGAGRCVAPTRRRLNGGVRGLPLPPPTGRAWASVPRRPRHRRAPAPRAGVRLTLLTVPFLQQQLSKFQPVTLVSRELWKLFTTRTALGCECVHMSVCASAPGVSFEARESARAPACVRRGHPSECMHVHPRVCVCVSMRASVCVCALGRCDVCVAGPAPTGGCRAGLTHQVLPVTGVSVKPQERTYVHVSLCTSTEACGLSVHLCKGWGPGESAYPLRGQHAHLCVLSFKSMDLFEESVYFYFYFILLFKSF